MTDRKAELEPSLARRIAELEPGLPDDSDGEAQLALAELLRRAGRLDAAERLLSRALERAPGSIAGRVVELLILEDAGRTVEARERLDAWAEAVLAGAGPGLGVSDAEFERAFDAAEPDTAQLITPDSVAEEATLGADEATLGADEATLGADEATLGADEVIAGSPGPESRGAFATRTMAELLERQGDAEGAARIRASLEASARPGSDESPPEGEPPAIAALERWLEIVRRVQS